MCPASPWSADHWHDGLRKGFEKEPIGTGAQAACGTSHFKFDSSGIANNWQDSQLAAPENDDNWYGEGGQDYLESQPCSDDLGVE
jgi:hypothetical protein